VNSYARILDEMDALDVSTCTCILLLMNYMLGTSNHRWSSHMDLPPWRHGQNSNCSASTLLQLFLTAPDTAPYMCSCLRNEMHFHPETPRGLLHLEQTDISQHETIIADELSPATGNPSHATRPTVTTLNVQQGVPLLAPATLQLKSQIMGC
jgi:hypothetical protein